MKSCLLLASAVFFSVQTSPTWSQSKACDMAEVRLFTEFSGSTRDAAVFLSKETGLSVLVEVAAPSQKVQFDGGHRPIGEVLASFGSGLTRSCEGSSIHIFAPNVLESKANALNFKFSYFQLGQTVDEFRLDFKERLRDEPWRTESDKHAMVRSGQGYLSADADKYRLNDEVIRDAPARKILDTVANEQQIVSVLELDVSDHFSPYEAWMKSEKTWLLQVAR